MRIYAASSWRNARHPATVEALREAGHEVYDFRDPPEPGAVFWGEDADPGWFTDREPERIKEMLRTPEAMRGFASDMAALEWADACVLTLPCGRSAHLELGWAVGAGKPTAVLLDGESEPELMYRMVGMLCADLGELVAWTRAQGHVLSDRLLGAAITDPGDDGSGWR